MGRMLIIWLIIPTFGFIMDNSINTANCTKAIEEPYWGRLGNTLGPFWELCGAILGLMWGVGVADGRGTLVSATPTHFRGAIFVRFGASGGLWGHADCQVS